MFRHLNDLLAGGPGDPLAGVRESLRIPRPSSAAQNPPTSNPFNLPRPSLFRFKRDRSQAPPVFPTQPGYRDRRDPLASNRPRGRSRSRSPTRQQPPGNDTSSARTRADPFAREPMDRDAAFRESLFDAMADPEGAAYWERVYGQPIHKYAADRERLNSQGKRMTDDEFAAYVRRKMWEKTNEGLRERRRGGPAEAFPGESMMREHMMRHAEMERELHARMEEIEREGRRRADEMEQERLRREEQWRQQGQEQEQFEETRRQRRRDFEREAEELRRRGDALRKEMYEMEEKNRRQREEFERERRRREREQQRQQARTEESQQRCRDARDQANARFWANISASIDASLKKAQQRRSDNSWHRMWQEYEKACQTWAAADTVSVGIIPWPLASLAKENRSKQLTRKLFEQGLFKSMGKEAFVARLKDERFRWHPDKMQQRLGGNVDKSTMEEITRMFQIIDELLREVR